MGSLIINDNFNKLWTDADYEDVDKFNANLVRIFAMLINFLNPMEVNAFKDSFVAYPEYFGIPYGPFYKLE